MTYRVGEGEHKVTYVLLTAQDDSSMPPVLAAYKHPSVSRFIHIDEENYWRYVTTTDNVFFHKVFDDNILVATTHCELIDRVLYLAVVVFPEYQRKGIGTRILRDFQNGMPELGYDIIRVSVEEENIASLKLFEKMGFLCIAKDGALLEYEYSFRSKRR